MKIGDKVKIRKWDDMVNEFGLDEDGYIKFENLTFVEEMKQYCGLTMTVMNVYKDGTFTLFGDGEVWEWREWMIEKEYQPKHAKEIEVHHPSHYQLHKHECIEEMIAVFGIEDTKTFCKLNVWKYRYRHTGKNGEKDLHKADEYMDILMKLQGETNED